MTTGGLNGVGMGMLLRVLIGLCLPLQKCLYLQCFQSRPAQWIQIM